MFLRATKYLFATALLVWTASPQPAAFAQLPKPRPDGPIEAGTDKPGIEAKAGTVDLDIQVKGPDGVPLAVMAVVTLTSKTGLISGQEIGRASCRERVYNKVYYVSTNKMKYSVVCTTTYL